MAMSANPGPGEHEPPPAGTAPDDTATDTATDAAPGYATEHATEHADEAACVPAEQAVRDVLDDDRSEQLPCGRPLDALWDTWTDDPAALDRDPHLATCPHCTTALGELRLLDEFVREEIERDEEIAAQSPADTGRITDRVMDIVRTELRPGASVPLGGPDEDHWITETAAARTFRNAAEREPGVAAGSCRIAPADGPERRFVRPGARLPRGPLRVRLGIVAPLRLSTPVPAVADAVRQRVTVAADRELGMEVTAVDVVVVDVDEDADVPEGAGVPSSADVPEDAEEGSR